MLRNRRKLAVTLTVLVATIGSTGTTFGQPPERVMENNGLTRVKKFYVVAAEDEIGKRFSDMVPVYNAMEAALNQFVGILQVEDNVQRLDNERILAETHVKNLDIQLSNFPTNAANNDATTVNAANIIGASNLRNERQRTMVYLTEVRGTLEIAKKNLVSPAQKQAVWNEFVDQRAAFLEADKQLRPIVDKAAKEYARLKIDPDVKDALRTIRRTNATLALGPSKDLTIVIGRLKRAEEMLSFDPDEYRRVQYAKSKRKSKVPSRPRPDPDRVERPKNAAVQPTGDLVLTDLAVNPSASGNFVNVQGRFRNSSGHDLQGLRVTVFMEDRAGKLVKSESAFCEPTTISSGGVGSFRVMPAADTRFVQVKVEFMGQEKAVPWVDRSGKDAHQ